MISTSDAKLGRRLTRAGAAGLAGTLAMLGVAAPANAAKAEFFIQNPTTAAMTAGQSAWLSTTFLGGPCQLSAFAMTISGLPNDYSVSYPTEPRSGADTSLSLDDSLGPNELDYASFYLSVPSSADAGTVSITAKIDYTFDEGCDKDGIDSGKIKNGNVNETLSVPVTAE